jgi:hypothetical protein
MKYEKNGEARMPNAEGITNDEFITRVELNPARPSKSRAFALIIPISLFQ